MSKPKTPKPVIDPVRRKFDIGVGAVLAQADRVSIAFGRPLGFALMVLALLICASANLTVLMFAIQGVARLF